MARRHGLRCATGVIRKGRAAVGRTDQAVRDLLGPGGPRERFAGEVADRRVEYDALVLLLTDNASADAPETRDVAEAIAAGCMGDRHLWRDLGLPDRATLREILETYFSPLAARNDRDMRWKKFLCKCLCRWEGFHVCRAPTCDACDAYEECFSPEV
jgi:nitrogen fixation protein NifQ